MTRGYPRLMRQASVLGGDAMKKGPIGFLAGGVLGALAGAVTLIQRLGSALNLNIHFHMLRQHPNTSRSHPSTRT